RQHGPSRRTETAAGVRLGPSWIPVRCRHRATLTRSARTSEGRRAQPVFGLADTVPRGAARRVLKKAPCQRERPCPRGSAGSVGAKTRHKEGVLRTDLAATVPCGEARRVLNRLFQRPVSRRSVAGTRARRPSGG